MIIAMKKAVLVLLKEDREPLLEALQRSGELMVIPPEKPAETDSAAEEALFQRSEKSLSVLKKYRDKKTAETPADPDYETFSTPDPAAEAMIAETEALTEEAVQKKAELLALKDRTAFLLPWEGLEENLLGMRKSVSAAFRTGTLDPRNLEAFSALLEELGGESRIFGKAETGIAVLAVLYPDDEPAFSDGAKNLGFADVSLPAEDSTVSALLENLRAQSLAADERLLAISGRLAELAKKTAEIGRVSDLAATLAERKKTPLAETMETVYLEGWVRSDRTKAVEKAVRSVTDVYDLEFLDPPEGEKPPTVTQNNKFVDAFESVTDMFSKPDPGEIDPNPVLAFWYWLIFGMMMGDVGYGVVMILLLGWMIKKMKPRGNTLRLFRVIFYSGFSTILWGIMFGSYFGFTWHPLLVEPINQSTKLLVICLILGMGHLITGLLLKAWGNARKKDWLAVYADSFAWIFLLVGVGLLFLPATAAFGKWLALLGAASIVLLGGRQAKIIPAKLGLGLYSLYGATSYLGDILSYSRILALAMSSGALALVMNLLAGMFMNGSVGGTLAGALIFLIGHVFNLAMGLLSAYVHASRLQYIEFFGKFYTGGGIPFRPLSLQLRHLGTLADSAE